ncbi:MAG: hypothetical protein ABI207_08615 [Crocinitomicaceae bacterium]
MKYFLLLIFSLLFGHYYSQTTKIWVIDSLTLAPIEGITMFSEHDFFYSDSNGLIQPKVIQNGLIWFKRLDYEQKWLDYKSDMDTIMMVKKNYLLNDVEVISKSIEDKTFEIGYYHKGDFIKKTVIDNNLCIIAVYVPPNRKNDFIDKILLSIKSRKFAEDYTVYLFEPDSTGKPGTILYQRNIIVNSLKKEGILDIRDLNIKIPNTGIFIGLENTKIYDYDDQNPIFGMGVMYEYTEKINTDLRYILFKGFVDASKNNVWTPLFGHKTPCFGLDVYQK